MEFIAWIENSAFGVTVRKSIWVYTTVLTLHAIGIGLLVGVNSMVDLRILGFAPRLPLAPMEKFLPIMVLGFWINALSGFVLLVGAPTKMLTDPVFYFKMLCVALAVTLIQVLRRDVFRGSPNLDTAPVGRHGRMLAAASLVLWALAITSGRLTAYTFFRFWNWR